VISPQDQIAKLERLLERVKSNAGRARVAVSATPVKAAAPSLPEPMLEPIPEPVLETEPPPPAAVAQPVVAEIPAPEVEEETSMVRAIPVDADEEVSVEMGEASIEDVDLLEDEIVDITDATAEEAPTAVIEEPPSSSRRAIAGTMDEALSGAAESVEMDEGREIPLKTPPPESGPQAAPLPAQALQPPPTPDLDELGQPELVSGTQPTAAQLGSTIDLPTGSETELELGEPVAEAPPVHLVREEPLRVAPPPPAEPVRPQVHARPPLAPATPPSAFASAARSFQPQSFRELLEASLRLGSD